MIGYPSSPPPYATLVKTTALRNALPSAVRYEGMLVYVVDLQVYYALKPSPWAFTDADWVIFNDNHPYVAPTMTALWITAQGNPGAPKDIRLPLNGTLSGAVTFQFRGLNAANFKSGFVTVTDVTTSTVLVSGASFTDGFQGTADYTFPSPITRSTPGTHVWRVSGLDIKGNVYSADFTVTWAATTDRTFYVRSDGSNSNSGTADNAGGAWLTLQHAANVADAGDTVLVTTSGNFAGMILGDSQNAVPSGVAGHPITFRATAGAVINHRNAQSADAVNCDTGCSYITIDQFHFTNDASITRAFVRFSGASTYGISITGNTLTGNNTNGRFGITTGFASQLRITGNTVTGIPAGGGNGTGHGIYYANGSHNVTCSNNTIHAVAGDGIHSNGDISQGGTGMTEYATVNANIIFTCNTGEGGAGINPDGLKDSTISNNLIYDAKSAGITCYRIDASNPSTGNVIVNNTVVLTSSATDKGCVQVTNGATGNTVFNNVLFSPAATSLVVSTDSIAPEVVSGGSVFDYNLYLTGTVEVEVRDDNDNTSSISLVTFKSTYNQESHSATGTTGATFTDLGGNDYTLTTTGPAINAGASTLNGHAAPTTDVLGNSRPFAGAWDCGAYESEVVTIIVTAKTPVPNATSVATGTTVTFTFDRPVDPLSIVFQLTNGGTVTGTLVYDGGTNTATFTPGSPLSSGVLYTATIEAATGLDSVTLISPVAWTFTTLGSHRLFGNAYTPPAVDGGDGSDLSLGVIFYTTATAATIAKVWFYKAVANTGTHVAKVWDATGTLLATKTFTGESSSGWQSAALDTPVSIAANTRYFVSVHMPNGHYSADNTIHTKSSTPLFTADVLNPSFHPSAFVSGDAWPASGSVSDNFYGVDVETNS